MLRGDFISLKFPAERMNYTKKNSEMSCFSEVIKELNLWDLLLNGGPSTWWGGRSN